MDIQKIKSQSMAGELAGGQTTVEYVIVVAIVLGLAALLFAFREQIGNAIKDATNKIGDTFNSISTNM